MKTIYFWSAIPAKYSVNKWRHVFSQWYMKNFKYDVALGNNLNNQNRYPYDLTPVLGSNHTLLVNKVFNCREQWMMAHKALIFATGTFKNYNTTIFNKIMCCNDPRKIKYYGRAVKGFDQRIWDEWKYEVVVNGNYLQFTQDNKLREILINTGNSQLVEASPSDRYWGIGYTEKDAEANRDKWGLNLLGKALVEVRSQL